MWFALVLALATPAPAPGPDPAGRQPACAGRLTAKPIISLDVRDADLGAVFRLLAEAAHVNIVVADDVRGTVTISIRDAPWLQVLCSVVQSKGLAASRDGGIYTVTAR